MVGETDLWATFTEEGMKCAHGRVPGTMLWRWRKEPLVVGVDSRSLVSWAHKDQEMVREWKALGSREQQGVCPFLLRDTFASLSRLPFTASHTFTHPTPINPNQALFSSTCSRKMCPVHSSISKVHRSYCLLSHILDHFVLLIIVPRPKENRELGFLKFKDCHIMLLSSHWPRSDCMGSS